MHVGVIGAGYAGLACAVRLVSRGARVTVFEAAKVLGGRARPLALEGATVDNGQHILVGAYRELLGMMRTVGADPDACLLRIPLTVEAGEFSLTAPRLPAPLHTLMALLFARGLSWREKTALVRLMVTLRAQSFAPPAGMTVAQLLAATDQPARVVALLWEPLCVAALNTPIDQACARVFACVLRDTLAARRADSDMLIPRVDLGAMFPQPAARWLAARGAAVRTGVRVRGLTGQASGWCLDTTDGPAFCDQVVVATAPHHAAKLLAAVPGCAGLSQQVGALEHQPILTCYLQYPRQVRLPGPMLSVANGCAQWLFDRGALTDQPGLIAAVISARGAHLELPSDAIAARVAQDVASVVGEAYAPAWHQVITEKRATFSCTPGLPRPHVATGAPGLWLAGDYLNPDYPATLESAVRSGVAVARAVAGESA